MWLTTVGQFFMVFKVQACHDASILLSELPGVTTGNAYEIVIGKDHTTNEIRLGVNGTVVAEDNTADVRFILPFHKFTLNLLTLITVH